MLNYRLLCLALLGLSSLASSSVPYARDGDIAVGDKWRPYDQVEIFQEGAARGLEGILELRFMPMLNDARGCFPYAAVDKDGAHGMGLKPTGKSGGDCRDDSKGQLYARVGTSNGRTGVMYSWYLPKVQTDTEHHKHWYLSIVVWVHSECNPAADDCNIVGVSYSSGAETYDTSMSGETLYSSGHNGTGPVKTHPIVGYDGQVKVFPSQDGDRHALGPPLISWEKLSLAARQQLNGFQYENARCPFNDNNFQESLDAAFNESFYTSLTSRSNKPSVPQPPPPSSRAKGPDLACMGQGPSFNPSNCVFSPIQDDGSVLDLTDAEAILRFMNVKTFLRYFKGSRADLTNTCVFYTKAVSPARKNVGLAITATKWACGESQKRRYTMWHLLPNAMDAASHPGVRDFYTPQKVGGWLDALRIAQEKYEATKPPGVVPPFNRYFQAGSQAMAEACYGDIVIVTETPSELAQYEPGKKYQVAGRTNVFWSHERPVIQRKVKAGEATLYVLDANTKKTYKVTDIDTFKIGPAVKLRRDLSSAYETSDIFERSRIQASGNLCKTSGLGSLRSGQDWFGS